MKQVVEADLTWTGRGFAPGVKVVIDDQGRIEEVGQLDLEPTVRLSGRALLPGMVNAHSHAFQRGLRGRGETFPEGQGSFWSWREQMYALVESMTESQIFELSKQAFLEMRDAGITSVGEFHYLHHDDSEAGYAFDETVLRAAAEAGIRVALLNVYYHTGGIGQAIQGGQRRFRSKSIDGYWAQMDALADLVDSAAQTLGVVAHSIRAAPVEQIVELQQEAIRRHLPFHMHVEEQPREIEDCVHAYGKPPLALLNERLTISPMCTFVHCTHSAAADLDEYIDAGGNICICPFTEANLGDGIANVSRMLRDEGHVCLGTDSNLRISMIEEMRWIEYGQRLAGQSRGVCRDKSGEVAPVLWEMATINGARSLGLKTGVIRPGMHADFMAIDLNHPVLGGASPESLLTALIFGAGNECIEATCVGGKWRESSRPSERLGSPG